jgi:hypothetical protein
LLTVNQQPATVPSSHDLFSDAGAERARDEIADRPDVRRQQVDVVDTAHARAAAVIALGQVLKRRPLGARRLVAAGLVIELEHMLVGIHESVGGAMPEIAVGPAEAATERLDRLDALRQRLRAGAAIADMGRAGRPRGGELQAVELVVVEAAQIDRIALAPAFRHPENVGEEGEARLRPVGQELDMREVRDVEAGFRVLH